MNDQKDINKDIIKDTNGTQDQGLFNPNTNDFFVFKKTEKIASVIHYITNMFGEDEPLKVSLRKESLQIISLSMSFIRQTNLSSTINSLSASLLETKSLLKIAVFSNLFSEKNFEILAVEIDNLLSILETKTKVVFSLPSIFLDMPVGEVVEENKLVGLSNIKDSYVRDTRKETGIFNKTKSPLAPFTRGGAEKTSPVSNSATIIRKEVKADFSNKTNSREEKIISILRTAPNLTIKDISEQFKDCGEKTIQRELLRLVSESKVLKRGERRWSRYSSII